MVRTCVRVCVCSYRNSLSTSAIMCCVREGTYDQRDRECFFFPVLDHASRAEVTNTHDRSAQAHSQTHITAIVVSLRRPPLASSRRELGGMDYSYVCFQRCFLRRDGAVLRLKESSARFYKYTRLAYKRDVFVCVCFCLHAW